MVAIHFTNKSNILSQLEKLVKVGHILPQISFTVDEFQKNPNSILNKVDEKFHDAQCIVRSSSLLEDGRTESKAGQYLSVLNVKGRAELSKAINDVIDSFDKKAMGDIVFIQPMLKEVELSGVAFTINPNDCGNYYVINYDDSGSTDSVTSGSGSNLCTYYLYKGHQCTNPTMKPIVSAIKELEDLIGLTPLDIEFACSKGIVYIFQVRPLANKHYRPFDEKEEQIIDRCKKKLDVNLSSKPNIAGNSTIFSVMTDWNPAEMIGIHPRPLSMSLYKRLITDREWAYQRHNYGYRDLRSFPLMVDFAGYPYIDTRVSFNSFVPAKLDDKLGSKLVDYYLDCLHKSPEKHDKVEFDIIFSCYSFDIDSRMSILKNKGFSEEEISSIKSSLLEMTNQIMTSKDGLWLQDNAKVESLESRRNHINSSDLDDVSKIYWLLEDCGRYGTLPFAGLARAGFVAVQLLRSLVNVGILSESDYQTYMGNLNTISSQMEYDYHYLSKKAFIEKYGHLRPGTYDITSQRYDVFPEKYFSDETDISLKDLKSKKTFTLSLEQYSAIDFLLKKHHFDVDVLELFDFIKNGIEGRERSKFIFTKSVSDILELLAKLGEDHGFSREDMSFVNISVFNELYTSSEDIRDVLRNSIESGKKYFYSTDTLTFPPIISNSNDVFEFFVPSCIPNYITTKCASGLLAKGNLSGEVVEDRILLIEAADPGYDWIFSHHILGFITKYGGANSHMAIRAGELGVPAVIGVGDQLFSQLQNAKTVFIDCNNHKIDMIR